MGKQQKRPPLKLVGEERPPLNLIDVKKKEKDESDLEDISVSEVGVLDTTEPIRDGVLESQKQPEETDLEEPPKDGFGKELFRSLKKGSARLGRDITAIPELLFDVFAAPQNAVAEAFGIESLATDSEELKKNIGIKNTIKDFYQRDLERLNKLSEELDKKYIGGITENFKAGNIADGFRILANSLAESLPSTLSIAFGGAATTTPKILGAVTATFAAGKAEELKISDPEITTNKRVINALGTGLAEGVFSSVTTARIGTAAREIIAKEGVEEGAKILKKNLIDIYTELLKKYPIPTAMLGEGLEESATQITQNAVDKYTGISPDIDLMDGVSDAFLLGVGSGGAFGTALEGIKKISKAKTTKENIETVENVIDERDRIAKELNEQLKEGEIPNQLASETIENFDEIKKQLQAIPKDFTPGEKAVAVDLLKEKSEIETEIQGLDDTLIEDRKSRIVEIDEELRNIKKPKVEPTEPTVSEEAKEFAEELGTPTDISDKVAGATSVKIGDTEVILNTEGDNIVLESIRTDEGKRGQGSAKNALDKVIEVADEQEKTIELKIVPETEEGLVKLYEDAGFVKEGNKMVREPKTGFEAIDVVISEAEPTKVTKEVEVKKVLPKQEIEVKKYTVTVKNSNLEIIPVFGKAKPSKAEIKKVTEQYLETNDFTTGKKAVLEGKGDLTPEQISDIVATESENSQEIAAEINNVRSRVEEIEAPKQNAIAEALKGVQVNQDSFSQTDDPNNIPDVNPYYFNARNKKLKGNEGNIDRIRERAQQNISDEVTLQDVTDFIKENASPTQFLKQPTITAETDLELKFEELTGLKPTQDNINKVSGTTITITPETEGEAPFQIESKQVRIKSTELNNLVDRLKKTGLANDVKILGDKEIADNLEKLGRSFETTPLGFVDKNTVYINVDKATRDTPVHEFSHLWSAYAKENFIDTYNKGIDLMKDSEYFNEINENPVYENLNEEEKLDEALSQAIGEKGVKILNESKKSKFNTWFKNLFTRIAKGLGITTLKGKQLSDITLSKFTDLVSAELLVGKQIVEKKVTKKEVKTKVKEADVTNIELVIKEQEAIKKTKDALTEKFENKKAEVKDIKTALTKYIRSNLDSKRVSEIQKSELSKLLTLVKNTDSRKKLLRAFNTVNDIVIGLDNKIIKRRINKILTSKFSKKQSGRRKANITTEEAGTILQSIRDNVNVPKTDDKSPTQRRDERLSELYDRRDVLSAKDDLSENEILELGAINISLDLLNAENTKDVNNENALLTKSLDQIEAIFEEGRSDLKEDIQKRREEDQEFIDNWIDDINPEGEESRLSAEELVKKEKLVGNIATRILNKGYFLFFQGQATGSFGSLTSLISNKGGETRQSSFGVQIDSNLKKQETAKKTRIKKFSKLFDDTIKEVFETNSKANKLLNKRVDVELLRNYENDDPNTPKYPVKVPFTYSELSNILQLAKNEKLLGGLEANGFNKDVIAKIEKLLPEKVKEFGDRVIELYDEAYIDANKVYEEMYFHSLGKPDFYAGKVYREGIDTKVEDNLFQEGVTKNTGYGSQKERVISNKKIVPKDVRFLYQRHILESSHFVAFAKAHRQLNKALKDEDLRKSILITNPKVGTDIINELEFYKVRDLEKGDFANYWLLDFFTRNIAKATLSLKGKIGLTQTVSIVNGSLDMPTNIKFKDFISYYEPITVIKTMLKLLKESDYLQNRYDVGGIESAMLALSNEADQNSLKFSNESLESKRKKVARIYKIATDKAMINVKVGDAIGVMGSIPMYNAWTDTFIKRGDSREVAEKKALDLFESSVDRSQQTISTFGKSRWQKDPIIRYFMMFTSSPIQAQQNANYYRRQLYKDIFTQKGFRGSRGRNILGFLNYQFAQPYLYYYISGLMAGSVLPFLGFGDDAPDDLDKDVARALILGNTQSIPLLGNALTYGVDMLLLDKDNSYGGLFSNPILEKIVNIETFVDRSVKAKSQATRTKNINKAIGEFSNLLTAFPNFAIDFYDDFNDVYWNSEIDLDIKIPKALGYSDFTIKKARTERMSRKEIETRIDKAKKKYEKSVDKLNRTETEKQRQKRLEKKFGKDKR